MNQQFIRSTLFSSLVVMATMIVVATTSVRAEILNIREAPFSAAADGTTDDRPALARVLAAAQPNDTVLMPAGDYCIVLNGGPLKVPSGVTLVGQAGRSRILLTSSGGNSEHREFLQPSSNVTLEGLAIERDTDFPTILFPLSGDAENIVFRHCRINGNKDQHPERYCHAFRVGYGVVKNLTFDGIVIEECCYGLFQPNQATGTLDGVTVAHCRFERNRSSDLEFNSPHGVMRNIVVRECLFRDNRSTSPRGGFAVGFANVSQGRVVDCDIRNYGSEALHVEDRSTDIELSGNTIIAGSTLQPNGVILIVNDSRGVRIEGNYIDGRTNTNSPHLILVTAGGKNFRNPSNVSVSGNVLVNGPKTRTWYLQDGSSAKPEANVIVPGGKAISE